MAVYDEENQEPEKKELSPEEIAEQEQNVGDSYNSTGGGWKYNRDTALGRHGKLRDQSLSADSKEREALGSQLQDTAGKFRKADEEAGFFKPTKKKGGLRGRLSGLRKRRTMLIAGGGIGVGVIGLFIALFSFLNVFRLDHILSSLDQQTFARFNASFEGRSDAWFRSYIRIRMAEIEGSINPADDDGNVFFRSQNVDTDNPVRDWYRTMRTSSFEDDLFKNQGIRFTSSLDASGNIRPALITIGDFRPDAVDSGETRVTIDPGTFRDRKVGDVNFNNFLRQLDGEFDAKIFNSSSEARRAIRLAVSDNTKSHQVFRRRHLRKDIYNMAGVREWRLFEKTRDKIDNTKISIQKKIMNKVFSGDSSSMRFLNCLLGGTGCPTTTDPVDPDNKIAGTPDGILPDDDSGKQIDPVTGEVLIDDDGNPVRGSPDGDSLTRSASEAVKDGVQEITEDFTPTQKVVKNVVDSVVKATSGPAAVWNWAKRLTSIHNMFGGGPNSTATKIVYNARMAQLVAFYATMAIGRDQIRSGELVGDELTAFYDMTNNFGSSEAWEAVNNSYDSSTVSAQATDEEQSVTKEEYCSSEYDRSFDEYAYYCDSFKPNSGSRAEALSTDYSNSIGKLIAPIAAAVNSVNTLPIIGSLINAFNSALGSVAGFLGDIGMAALRGLGLADNLESAIGSVVAWLLEFAGAGPFIDPGQPGFAAWTVGGSAGAAETATRSSGGVGSTTTTYEYSSKLANAYKEEQLASMSWSERYLSLENPDSIGASFAYAASNVVTGESLVSKFVGAMQNIPTTLANLASGRVGAQSSNTDLAGLAGVNKYDIPQVCMNLDPLDPEYLSKATNAQLPNRTYQLITNETTFWQTVYDNKDGQSVPIEQIYNCALLDQRVRGSMGYLYGYTQDGGYDDASSGQASNDPTAPTGIVGNPFESSVSVPCAVNTIDLGVQEAYNDGQPVDMRMCGIPNLPSSSDESNPANSYYVDGANRKAIVNSRVSGAVYSMVAAAAADGVTLTASSSFRTMSHQQDLFTDNPDPTYTAPPGRSPHQTGVALDLNAGGVKGGSTCAQRARATSNPAWGWLFSNAERFGYKQYSAESWHWDPSSLGNRCDSSQ